MLATRNLNSRMLQIFHPEPASTIPVSDAADAQTSITKSPSTRVSQAQDAQALLQQLRSETELRVFLEGAVDLLSPNFSHQKPDPSTNPRDDDRSTLANILELLNRIAGTEQTMLLKSATVASDSSGVQIIENSQIERPGQEDSSALLDESGLRRLVSLATLKRQSLVPLSFTQEALIVPVVDGCARTYWLVGIGRCENVSQDRTLKQQRALFRSAAQMVAKIVNESR